jgi:hypothetical protein
MIHLIRNEGIFDLFLNDDEKKENQRLKRRDSKDSDEIKIPKKRGRKPRNFIETERLKELEKKMNHSKSNLIDLDSDTFLSEKRYSDNNFRNNNFNLVQKSKFKKDNEDDYFKIAGSNGNKTNDNKDENENYNEKDYKETDICVEI